MRKCRIYKESIFSSRANSKHMRTLFQIGIVLGVCLVGEAIHGILPFPIPGSVISMILLFLLLFSGLIKPKHIKKNTDFVLKNMAFFFIPAGVSIMDKFSLLESSLLQFLLICLITYFLTFAATVYTVKAVTFLQNKHGGTKE